MLSMRRYSIEHEQRIEKTQHPVQTGASISDHAYIIPARLVLDIRMSDAIDAYYNPSTWSGSSSKSVSAYQTMLAISFSRIPLSITTGLRTYTSMIIESLAPVETSKTIGGLRMRIEFGQIFMADTSQPTISARPQDTDSTNLGTKDPQTPTDAQESQNNITDDSSVPQNTNTVGAGDWSSNAVGLIALLF